MRVAAHLRIPFITIDARREYERDVAQVMIDEYKQGRTPNPDILCNRVVKFGAFEEARRAHGADFIATGHYARVVQNNSGIYELHAAVDLSKDQSYFLAGIPRSVLPHVLFPLGESAKSDIRREAARAGLPSAARRDSQGICFLGKLDMRDFLKHYIHEHEGNVLDVYGNVIGMHMGAHFYTFGERHGFTITNSEHRHVPHYVVAKDVTNNTLTVSNTPPEALRGANFMLKKWNQFVDIGTPDTTFDAVFRYHGKRIPATIALMGEEGVLTVQDTSMLPAPGQTAVIYQGTQVVGSGIIM
jgi:tRNA-specific 2-thiouridylase